MMRDRKRKGRWGFGPALTRRDGPARSFLPSLSIASALLKPRADRTHRSFLFFVTSILSARITGGYDTEVAGANEDGRRGSWSYTLDMNTYHIGVC